MNTPRTALTAAALLAAAALSACDPATTAGAGAPASATTSSATPTCALDFGPDGTGLHAYAGTVTASVSLNCTGPYDTPDPLISLTLVHDPDNADAKAVGHAAYQHPDLAYTATAACTPGPIALHVLYGATVDHHALSDQKWGRAITLTAADCG